MKKRKINSKMFINQLVFTIAFWGVLCNRSMANPDVSSGQEIKSLESDIDSSRTNQIDVLSPHFFTVAKKYLEDAQKNLEKQNEISKEIHKQILTARDYLDSAKKAANTSQGYIKDIVEARRHAIDAGADVYFSSDLKKADDQLKILTADLEFNNTQNLEKNRLGVQSSYLNLELRAIKHKNLAEARSTIIQAIKDGAKIYAPADYNETLKTYRNTLVYINGNRHNNEQIISKAKDLNEKAKQLLNLTHAIAETRTMTPAEVAVTNNLVEEVTVRQSAVTTPQKTLTDKLKEARLKFSSSEAELDRRGNMIIIRLKGFEFPSSGAALKDSNLLLLGKVQKAIKELDAKSVIVEGHTDSIGSETANVKLSRDRAKTVKDYFLSVEVLPLEKIKAIGYGENYPIATNRSEIGRAQNRRVDILVGFE